MTDWPITSLMVRQERDIVHARQRARIVAGSVGFTSQDQTRIATAVSEIARNAFAYAKVGKVAFAIVDSKPGPGAPALDIRITDAGPGIAGIEDILAGRYHSKTGMGLGIAGARRLMDRFEVETSPRGTAIVMQKLLPATAPAEPAELVRRALALLAEQAQTDPVEEVQRQNVELIASLNELRQREDQLVGANASLRETGDALRASLAEKDILMREVYHRVKNNLQIIASLLSLQAARSTDDAAREELAVIGNRIHSMSLIHEKLYQSDDVSRIDIGDYIHELCAHLQSVFADTSGPVRLQVDARPLPLPLDSAIHLGLIVNEVVTNCFKHAFPGGKGGAIGVSLVRDPKTLTLSVTDDGQGLPAMRNGRRAGLGLTLIEAMVKRLDGGLTIDGDGGTRVTITMPMADHEGQAGLEAAGQGGS